MLVTRDLFRGNQHAGLIHVAQPPPMPPDHANAIISATQHTRSLCLFNEMSVSDTRLSNTHAIVLGHLQQAHRAELESTKAELERANGIIASIVEFCHSNGIALSCCDQCNSINFIDDLPRCEECLVSACYECNDDLMITVHGGAELCRSCKEMTLLDTEGCRE